MRITYGMNMNNVLLTRSLAALLILVALFACSDQEEPVKDEKRLRLVKTLTIGDHSDSSWREFPAVVEASQKADLSFRVSGELVKFLIVEGEEVKQGQILAQLDASDYEIQLQRRKAEYDQANADYSRGQALIKKGLLSQSDFDRLKALNSASEANLNAASKNLGYTSIRAPFSGIIAKKYVDNFEEVSVKQAILALHDQAAPTIKLDAPENLIILADESQFPEIYASFNAIPNKAFPLDFLEISTQADPNTNTFEVTLGMQSAEGYNILPGMSVTVRAKRDSKYLLRKNSHYVPAHAVLENDMGRYVYLVNQTQEGLGVVERRIVETAVLSDRGLEITAGLDQNDKVITAGMSKMQPGLKVRIAMETAH